jgi:hypothetical protein
MVQRRFILPVSIHNLAYHTSYIELRLMIAWVFQNYLVSTKIIVDCIHEIGVLKKYLFWLGIYALYLLYFIHAIIQPFYLYFLPKQTVSQDWEKVDIIWMRSDKLVNISFCMSYLIKLNFFVNDILIRLSIVLIIVNCLL